jgi:hypothetical protein
MRGVAASLRSIIPPPQAQVFCGIQHVQGGLKVLSLNFKEKKVKWVVNGTAKLGL